MNRFSRRKLLKLAAPALILSAAPKLVRATQLPVSTLRSPLAYPAGVPTGFDPSHPASPNCWLSTAVNSGATGAYNILTGKPGTINGTPTFVQDSVIGPSIKYSNATDSTEFSGFSTNATNSLLFAAIFRAPTAQAANQFIVTNTAGSATGILYLTLTTNLVSMQLGGSLTYTSTLGCTAGRWYFIVACGPNSTVAECNIVVLDLLNGEMQTVFGGVAVGSGGNNSDGNILIGNRSTSRELGSNIARTMLGVNNILLPSQMVNWALNPWDFWHPPQELEAELVGVTSAVTTHNLPLLGVGQ